MFKCPEIFNYLSLHSKWLNESVFTDNMNALKNIWLVGDAFLSRSQATLYAMRSEATSMQKQLPYIFDYYNTRTYFTNPRSDMKSVLAHIYNSVIKGINANAKLPKYVIVCPDKDIVHGIPANYSEKGTDHIIEQSLKFLIREINTAFDIRKDEICNKKPGAMSTALEPRIIWVSMINRTPARIAYREDAASYFFKKRFNEILCELILNDRYSHYIEITSVDNYTDFDRSGLLSAAGKYQFWREVINAIKRFDHLKTELKPVIRH